MSVDRCAEIRNAPFSGLTEYCTVCREGAGKRGLESGLTEYCTVCRKGAGKRGLESGLTEYCTVCRKGAGKRGLESGEWLNRVLHSLREGCRKAKVGESARRAPPPPPSPPTPRSSFSRPTAYTTCDCECSSKCSPLLKQQAHLAETSAYHVPFSVQGVDLSSTKITQKPARPKGFPPPPPPPPPPPAPPTLLRSAKTFGDVEVTQRLQLTTILRSLKSSLPTQQSFSHYRTSGQKKRRKQQQQKEKKRENNPQQKCRGLVCNSYAAAA